MKCQQKYEIILSVKDFDKYMEIKSNDFYKSESDKTKANWFNYEFANKVYDAILETLKEQNVLIPVHHSELKELSVSIAKIAINLLRFRKKTGGPITILSEVIKSPILDSLNAELVEHIGEVVNKCLGSQLEVCEICSTRCIYDLDGICYMFDEGPY